MLNRRPTENTEAYAWFLRAREMFRSGSEETIRRASTLFEKSIEADPHFAEPYAELGDCLIRLSGTGSEDWEELSRRRKPPMRRPST